jgi:membrane protein YqaA with SNARE-associated domain
MHIMDKQTSEAKEICETTSPAEEEKPQKKSARLAYTLGIIGVILTLLMAAAIVLYDEQVKDMQQYGYVGAFLISILGGATIIIPVPMLAIVFALGGVMPYPWLVAISAALGELVGALTIYMTGHGAGRAISSSKHGKIQKAYERMLDLMERRGAITLFAVTSIVNPFFYPAAFACGALHFGLKKYIAIVLVGKIIKCMTVVYAGYWGLKGIFRAIGIEL